MACLHLPPPRQLPDDADTQQNESAQARFRVPSGVNLPDILSKMQAAARMHGQLGLDAPDVELGSIYLVEKNNQAIMEIRQPGLVWP